MNKVGIIGGGAAGLMAAAHCKGDVTVLEKNEKLGKKIYITGKGRCNVTNNCALYEFFPNIVNGEKFMMSSLSAFPPPALMELLGANGVRTKTERGNRVFPSTDKSSDVISALVNAVRKNGAKVLLETEVNSVEKRNEEFVVNTNNGEFTFDKLIVATGGVSYKATGSTGDGYKIAQAFGHKVVSPVPALSAIELIGDVKPLEGLSLKNVSASVKIGNKTFSRFGEMLFTDKGVSGPIILTLSSYINRFNLNGEKLCIDFKPALSPETLDARLSGDFVEFRNKDLANILCGLLPKAIIPYVLNQSGISGSIKGHSITREQRYALGYSVKNLMFRIKKLADVNLAIITSGGVELKEINPKTMESKLVNGLYFAGETINVDALTGGFNLQCAFAMGRAAGLAAGEYQ
ncbi:MAG: NAD(P)/FAD-dependent oxidoreductase [Clostridia bacterium]|nr:NAD(P)/FAD-dependent oxidoreductase [Clostridia bacterium]